jgi:hypothetical protein
MEKEVPMKVLALVLVLLLGVPVASANDATPTPSYLNGEYWVYKADEERAQMAGTGSRDGFGTGTYKIEILEDGKLRPDSIFARALPSIYEGPTTKSGKEWYRFPLKVGDNYPVRWISGRWIYGTVKVVAKEPITVPAGTLETYKLVLEAPGRGDSYQLYEYFYAPSAKATVKILYKQYAYGEVVVRRNVELTSFSVQKPTPILALEKP